MYTSKIVLLFYYLLFFFNVSANSITVVVIDALTFERCNDCKVEVERNGSFIEDYKLNKNGKVSIKYDSTVVLRSKTSKKNYFGSQKTYRKEQETVMDTLWVYPNKVFEEQYYKECECQYLRDSIENLKLEREAEEDHRLHYYRELAFSKDKGPSYGFKLFLSKNFLYPEIAKEKGDYGKVFIEFVVDKEGDIKCPIVLKGVSQEIDAEGLRLVRKMPRWNPTTYKGEGIATVVRVPINFLGH